MRTIALLTDFGAGDNFAGVMKGVILGRSPGASVVDLCHGVPPQDVRAAAFQLMAAVPFFPDGTLFVCVVDPGVGSDRAVLWARGAHHSFLAPDNGLLSWAGPLREVRRVTDASLFLKPVSRTFHGRDVFAPVAAALAGGLPPERLGPRTRVRSRLRWPEPRRTRGGWRGEVVLLDRYGNAVTSLAAGHLGRGKAVEAGGLLLPLRSCYAEAAEGEGLAVVGSAGLVELSVRGGDFSARYGVRVGDTVHAR